MAAVNQIIEGADLGYVTVLAATLALPTKPETA